MNLVDAIHKKIGIFLAEDDLESVFSLEDNPSNKTICVVETFLENSEDEVDDFAHEGMFFFDEASSPLASHDQFSSI